MIATLMIIAGIIACLTMVTILIYQSKTDGTMQRIANLNSNCQTITNLVKNLEMENNSLSIKLKIRQLKIEEISKELESVQIVLKEEQDKNANLKLLNESLMATIKGLEPAKRKAKISIITKPKTEDKASDL